MTSEDSRTGPRSVQKSPHGWRMRGHFIGLLELTVMMSYATKFCQGFSRPLPKETLKIAVDVPATVINRSKLWFDTDGETYAQPDLQKNDIKIISYNILGTAAENLNFWKRMSFTTKFHLLPFRSYARRK